MAGCSTTVLDLDIELPPEGCVWVWWNKADNEGTPWMVLDSKGQLKHVASFAAFNVSACTLSKPGLKTFKIPGGPRGLIEIRLAS